MNSRNLSILAAIAAVILIAAVWIGIANAPKSSESEPLYPALKGKLETVTAVNLLKNGEQPIVQLSRDGSNWKVNERHGYPANAAKIRSLLIKLEEAVLREEKTSNPANYAALGVADVTDPASSGVRLTLTGVTPPVDLIVGKRDQTTQATYVRRTGEKKSWLASGEIEVAADPTQWLKREIVNIGSDRIQEVNVQLAGAPGYLVVKNKKSDVNFDVKSIPKGRELNSVSAPNVSAQGLTVLQLDDVRPQSELANEKSIGTAVFKTFDGLTIACTGFKNGEQRWITLKAEFDAGQAKQFFVPAAAVAPAADKAQSPPASAPASNDELNTLLKKGEEEAAEINKNVNAWAFALPSFKFDAIFRPIDDLLKKREPLK